MSVVAHDIDGLDDIGVLESRADAKLRGNLLLVFLLRLTNTFWPELLDGKDMTTVLVTGFDEAHRPACTGAKDATPFAILLGEMRLGGAGKGIDGMWTRRGTETRGT